MTRAQRRFEMLRRMASLAPAPSLYLGAEAGEQEAPVVYRARLPEGTYDHPPVELHLEPPIEPLR